MCKNCFLIINFISKKMNFPEKFRDLAIICRYQEEQRVIVKGSLILLARISSFFQALSDSASIINSITITDVHPAIVQKVVDFSERDGVSFPISPYTIKGFHKLGVKLPVVLRAHYPLFLDCIHTNEDLSLFPEFVKNFSLSGKISEDFFTTFYKELFRRIISTKRTTLHLTLEVLMLFAPFVEDFDSFANIEWEDYDLKMEEVLKSDLTFKQKKKFIKALINRANTINAPIDDFAKILYFDYMVKVDATNYSSENPNKRRKIDPPRKSSSDNLLIITPPACEEGAQPFDHW